MEKVQIKVSGLGQDLNFSVGQEVAARIVRILNESAFASQSAQGSPSLVSVSAKYRPLAQYLAAKSEHEFSLGFDQIEEILGEPLPESAYKHKAWWANSRTHSQATAWMVPGFVTCDVNPISKMITFQKEKM